MVTPQHYISKCFEVQTKLQPVDAWKDSDDMTCGNSYDSFVADGQRILRLLSAFSGSLSNKPMYALLAKRFASKCAYWR